MSWRAYEILTFSPDFGTAPRQGIVDDREESTLGGNQRFVAWPDKTDRVLGFTFQTMSSNEWKIMREFFDRHGGRAKAFYLPSWSADFELAEDAAAGQTTITVAGNALSSLTENRPDTIGRRLMFYNQAGQVSTHWVNSAANTGEGTDIVALDPPLLNSAEAGRTVLSICYLVRLTEDTLRSDHASPRHATVELTFREISHRRRLDQEEIAPGVEIETLHASSDLIATDEDPIYLSTIRSASKGPRFYGITQGVAYASDWQFEVNPGLNTVTILSPGGILTTSALYNGTSPPTHLTGTFDALSKEIIAWETDRQVTVAYYSGSAPTRLTFPGLSPVAFNTYAIDSTVDAGTATIAVFYLREQDASIYCRISLDNFSVERRYCKSPVAPLALHAARRLEGRMELIGMDTNHRLVRWRSEPYQTPQETQVLGVSIDGIDGESMEIVVMRTGIDSASATIAGIDGEFQSIALGKTARDTMGVAMIETTITGTSEEVRIPRTATDQLIAVVVDNTITGTYTLVAKTATGTDGLGAIAAETITGSYT